MNSKKMTKTNEKWTEQAWYPERNSANHTSNTVYDIKEIRKNKVSGTMKEWQYSLKVTLLISYKINECMKRELVS